jgi:hypothetical protein
MANSGTQHGHAVDAGLGDVGSATVTSLPLGYALGQQGHKDGVEYKLVFNAGNSAIPPGMVAGLAAGNGVNSVTVSTAAQVFAEVGAVVNNSAASVATAAYFWGARKGYLASGLVASAVCIPSGSAFYVSTNGNVVLMPQSVITGVAIAGVAVTTVLSTTSGGGRNGAVIIDLK